ncbi:MAG: transglycosylase domain-containing protein, partial [Deltaproteobacteria bacterium]|nr:transglycosylase domain-containing protein [Deltaproteobacteria bacterium]
MARPRRRLLALGALALASIAYGLALGAIFRAVAQPLPIDRLAPKSVTSRRLLDRHGILLREILARPDGRAHWVDLDAISPHLIAATLASEDQRFYEHAGVDPRALLRALLLNVTHGRIMSGGSTLTMQLARLLSPEPRSLGAKTRQITRAIKLEALLSKTQILTQYLNRAPYGGGSFGVEAAARRYFAKPAAEVSLAEATLLAALPRSPQGYSPLQASGRRRVRRRQRYILAMMRRQKRIDDESLRIALAEPLALERLRRP